ncbi:MAG: hypothetical protein QOJ63_3034 [Solirubrobacteraceae bacterium]|nr:hypothetical protein [Solirubrobacteraceae bacterium]
MSADYPYDDDVLELVARQLYDALPAMYRVPDEPPTGRGELRSLLDVLAAPLAVVRQSIEELHADLFIDTADARIVPYLAEMVGLRLVFPDAESNRRDVRGTVAWRRRKGTPAALEEMGSELTGQSVVVQEGWKRIQLAQDLNLLRGERIVVDVRPGIVAEQADGPLDALVHAADVRRISATTGRRHPLHVAHWLHATVTFPLVAASAVGRSRPGSDARYAMHPLGGRHALRARRIAGDREPFVDRVQEQHFAAAPERWFAQQGGFTVRVCGLPAAIAGAPAAERAASTLAARAQLCRAPAAITLLEQPSRGWRGGVGIELGLATVNGGGDTWRPNPDKFVARASIELDAGGVVAATAALNDPAPGTRVPMLRLRALGGAPGRFFPGATLELASAAEGSTVATADVALAREGFLRGALNVQVPPLRIRGDRWMLIAADGSVYEAADTSPDEASPPELVLVDMPRVDGELLLAPAALACAGPGAAWPPLAPEGEPRWLDGVPGSPGRGPAVLHGARPLRRPSDEEYDAIQASSRCALAFAAHVSAPGGARYRPFQRLAWTGPDPGTGSWTALDADGAAVDAQAGAAEYAAVARLRDADPDAIALAVRFECSQATATLCPGEVAWSAGDARTVLVHLPQLHTTAVGAADPWPVQAPFAFVSAPVRVAQDGSTWAADSTAGRRASLGAVAPIAAAAALRRRRVRWRRLCAWDREDWDAPVPEVLDLTAAGRLDVDVTHGLFAFAAGEPPQSWPPGPDAAAAPPSVTTDYEEGATMHLGARPAAREPVLDVRLERPTRLVSYSGALHAEAPPDWHDIPRYGSLQAALAAVSERWEALTAADLDGFEAVEEVIQLEDSATYAGERPLWPAVPADQAVRARARLRLTIQAAERERPIVLVDAAHDWALPQPAPPLPAPRYDALTLRGIALGGEGWGGMTLAPASRVALELCSVLHAGNELTFADLGTGKHVSVALCETDRLVLSGGGVLTVADSIVDGRPGQALRAPAGEVVLERVSVGGDVAVRVLEASEVIFDGLVAVEDRFRGCVRYSRVTEQSTLPRVHRVAVGTDVRVVSRNRRDAAWWRLRADCDPAITRGAENGSEMGAFSLTQLAERMTGFERRLGEFTPAGLVSAIIRID